MTAPMLVPPTLSIDDPGAAQLVRRRRCAPARARRRRRARARPPDRRACGRAGRCRPRAGRRRPGGAASGAPRPLRRPAATDRARPRRRGRAGWRRAGGRAAGGRATVASATSSGRSAWRRQNRAHASSGVLGHEQHELVRGLGGVEPGRASCRSAPPSSTGQPRVAAELGREPVGEPPDERGRGTRRRTGRGRARRPRGRAAGAALPGIRAARCRTSALAEAGSASSTSRSARCTA